MHLHGFTFSLIELAVEVRYTYLVDVHALKYVTSVSTSFHSYVCTKKELDGDKFFYLFLGQMSAPLWQKQMSSQLNVYSIASTRPTKKDKRIE